MVREAKKNGAQIENVEKKKFVEQKQAGSSTPSTSGKERRHAGIIRVKKARNSRENAIAPLANRRKTAKHRTSNQGEIHRRA